MIQIGDQVTMPNGSVGILRWTGRISGKPIEYAGVELLSGQGRHSGEHEGHKYFSTKVPGQGIFVSYSKLVSSNVVTPLSRLGNSRLPALSPSKHGTPRSFSPPLGQQTDNNEIARLNATLEEREAKIKELKAQMDVRRAEFRKYLESVEADRNQMAEHYESLLREYTQGPKPSNEPELDVQRTALAAMQNKLMEENEQMRQALEAAERRLAAVGHAAGQVADPAAKQTTSTGDVDLDAVLGELSSQESRLKELQQQVEELDELRAENTRLVEKTKVLEQNIAQMETCLDEVASLKDSLGELTLAAPAVGPDEQTAQEIEDLKKLVETHKNAEQAQKRRAEKYSGEAEQARKDAQMYFKMSDPDAVERDKAKIKDLESKVRNLEQELENAKAAAKVAAPVAAPKAAVPVPVAAGPTAASTSELLEAQRERELEDQILRDAGLLGAAPLPPTSTRTIDPTAGRALWCGLCEREGHTSVDCPYD